MTGTIKHINELTELDIKQMFMLMSMFYDDVDFGVFTRDLYDKQICIILIDENKQIQGFSTQKIISVEMDSGPVHGVFTGDTIIHKDHWGSWILFRLFARYYIEESKKYDHFYWFLTSKGYKTYKVLPLFYKEYYPNRSRPMPEPIRQIVNRFGAAKYPEDFNPKTGVIEYRQKKDKLKPDIEVLKQKHLNDPDIVFFNKQNPGHVNGNDLVCLTRLTEDNLTQQGKKLLLNTD